MREQRRAKLDAGRSRLSAAEGGTTSGRRPMGRRHMVAALAFDGVSPFELSVACEVFGFDRSDLGVPWYRFMVCSVEGRPVVSEVGFEIHTPHGLADLKRADTVIVPMRYTGDAA